MDLAELKAWTVRLEETIRDKPTRDHFGELPKEFIGDVERGTMPSAGILSVIEMLLRSVQAQVDKYGPTIQIRG